MLLTCLMTTCAVGVAVAVARIRFLPLLYSPVGIMLYCVRRNKGSLA